MDTLRRFRTSIVVLTAKGEVHTHEEAQVFAHDLNLFVTVQLLEDTPAVLSLGKWQGLLAEDALAKLYLEQKSLVKTRENHRYAVGEPDLATQWIQTFPCKTKTSHETERRSLLKFFEPSHKAKGHLHWQHVGIWKILWRSIVESPHLTPHRSETNGISERAVRRVKRGTSAILLQSGLDDKWSSDSMECFCYLWNVQDLLADGRTPFQRRFG